MRRYIGGVIATALTLFLLFNAKDYPCLRGSGLAMADLEAFLLSLFIALPCFIWGAIWLFKNNSSGQPGGNKMIRRMALFSIAGTVVFWVLAIPVIVFTSEFPLQSICGQPYLAWLFQYPM